MTNNMKYCKNCGKEIPDGFDHCPHCGEASANAEPSDGKNYSYNHQGEADFKKVVTVLYDDEDINRNKRKAALAYISLLFILPFLDEVKSGFATFHAFQGLRLFILELLCSGLFIIPVIGWIAGIVGLAFCGILAISGIHTALKGEAKELPFIGRILVIK